MSEATKLCEPIFEALKQVENGNWIAVPFKDLPGETQMKKRALILRAANVAGVGIQTATSGEKLYLRIKADEVNANRGRGEFE